MGATATNDAGSGATKGAASPNASGSSPANVNAGAMGKTIGPQDLIAPLSNGQGSMNGQNAMNAGHGMQISKTLKKDLDKAGFTDVKIMPESFLEQAKDSQGTSVIMMINPSSVTALTEETRRPTRRATPTTAPPTTATTPASRPGRAPPAARQPVTPGGATKP